MFLEIEKLEHLAEGDEKIVARVSLLFKFQQLNKVILWYNMSGRKIANK